MTKPPSRSPYEIVSEGASRAFVAVLIGNSATYLPWYALKRMHHDESRALLTLEFAHESVEISGSGLANLAELCAVTRLKLLRQGESEEVRINTLHLVTDNS